MEALFYRVLPEMVEHVGEKGGVKVYLPQPAKLASRNLILDVSWRFSLGVNSTCSYLF